MNTSFLGQWKNQYGSQLNIDHVEHGQITGSSLPLSTKVYPPARLSDYARVTSSSSMSPAVKKERRSRPSPASSRAIALKPFGMSPLAEKVFGKQCSPEPIHFIFTTAAPQSIRNRPLSLSLSPLHRRVEMTYF